MARRRATPTPTIGLAAFILESNFLHHTYYAGLNRVYLGSIDWHRQQVEEVRSQMDTGPVLVDEGVPFTFVPFAKAPAPKADKLAKARADIAEVAKICGWE